MRRLTVEPDGYALRLASTCWLDKNNQFGRREHGQVENIISSGSRQRQHAFPHLHAVGNVLPSHLRSARDTKLRCLNLTLEQNLEVDLEASFCASSFPPPLSRSLSVEGNLIPDHQETRNV